MSIAVSKTYTNTKFSFFFEKDTINIRLDPICLQFRPYWSIAECTVSLGRLHHIKSRTVSNARTKEACALAGFFSHKQALCARQILHNISTNLAQFSTSSALRMTKITNKKLPLDVMYNAILPRRFTAFQQSVANLQCIHMCVSSSRSWLQTTQIDRQWTPRLCKLVHFFLTKFDL